MSDKQSKTNTRNTEANKHKKQMKPSSDAEVPCTVSR